MVKNPIMSTLVLMYHQKSCNVSLAEGETGTFYAIFHNGLNFREITDDFEGVRNVQNDILSYRTTDGVSLSRPSTYSY